MYPALRRVNPNTVNCFRKDPQEFRGCDKRRYGTFRWVLSFFGALQVFPWRLLVFRVLSFQLLVVCLPFLLSLLMRSAFGWYRGCVRTESWDAGLEQTAVVGVELLKLKIGAIASNESHFQVLHGSTWLWQVKQLLPVGYITSSVEHPSGLVAWCGAAMISTNFILVLASGLCYGSFSTQVM